MGIVGAVAVVSGVTAGAGVTAVSAGGVGAGAGVGVGSGAGAGAGAGAASGSGVWSFAYGMRMSDVARRRVERALVLLLLLLLLPFTSTLPPELVVVLFPLPVRRLLRFTPVLSFRGQSVLLDDVVLEPETPVELPDVLPIVPDVDEFVLPLDADELVAPVGLMLLVVGVVLPFADVPVLAVPVEPDVVPAVPVVPVLPVVPVVPVVLFIPFMLFVLLVLDVPFTPLVFVLFMPLIPVGHGVLLRLRWVPTPLVLLPVVCAAIGAANAPSATATPAIRLKVLRSSMLPSTC